VDGARVLPVAGGRWGLTRGGEPFGGSLTKGIRGAPGRSDMAARAACRWGPCMVGRVPCATFSAAPRVETEAGRAACVSGRFPFSDAVPWLGFDPQGHRGARDDTGGGEARDCGVERIAGGFMGDDQHRGFGAVVIVLAHPVDRHASLAHGGGDFGQGAGFVGQRHPQVLGRGGGGFGGGHGF
jgi:hypothetical protein